MMTLEEARAIEVIARMVVKTGSYDYVDDTVEIRLRGEEKEVFDNALEELENRQFQIL
jgi:hypothetical protein